MGICGSCGGLGNRPIQRMAYASHGSHVTMIYDSCQQCYGSGRTPDYRYKGASQSNGLMATLSVIAGILVSFKLSQLGFYLDLDLGWKLMVQTGAFFSTMIIVATFLSLPTVRKAINWITFLSISGSILSLFLS